MTAPAVTVGVNAFTPNSSASLLVDSRHIGSVEEERFRGPKRAAVWPANAIRSLLDSVGLDSSDVSRVAVNFDPAAYDGVTHDPVFTYEDIRRRTDAFSDARARLVSRLNYARRQYPQAEVSGVHHHRAHATYAYAASGYEDAAVVILDSVGETISSSIWRAHAGPSRRIELMWTGADYSSLGYFYGTITEHLGWNSNDEEGTVMALAALGDPARFRPLMQRLIQLDSNGVGHIDTALLPARVRRVKEGFTEVFADASCPRRAPGEGVQQVHCDFAAAAQERLEELVVVTASRALGMTGARRLVLSGGVAENCVANARVAGFAGADALYVPAAPGDAGTSLGAALVVHPESHAVESSAISDPRVGHNLNPAELDERFRRTTSDLTADRAAEALVDWCADGEVVGLVRGRCEYGPRALGNRSLIASPFVDGVVETLNRTVKKREPFRPFAPVVRAESVGRYFDLPAADVNLGTMSLALPVKDGDALASVMHANGLARLQTVTEHQNPVLWGALRLMEEGSGIGVLINTSLNVKGQPICGTASLLNEFAKRSAVRRFLIDEVAYEYDRGEA